MRIPAPESDQLGDARSVVVVRGGPVAGVPLRVDAPATSYLVDQLHRHGVAATAAQLASSAEVVVEFMEGEHLCLDCDAQPLSAWGSLRVRVGGAVVATWEGFARSCETGTCVMNAALRTLAKRWGRSVGAPRPARTGGAPSGGMRP